MPQKIFEGIFLSKEAKTLSFTVYVLCKTKNKGTSFNTDNRSNPLCYQYSAYYFLALLSFLPMKENYKKDLHHCKRGRESECTGESEGETREIVFIACGRWMMAQHKNRTKLSRWSLCDSKTPNVRWRFLPVTYESYLSKQRQELEGWYANEAALLWWQIMFKKQIVSHKSPQCEQGQWWDYWSRKWQETSG